MSRPAAADHTHQAMPPSNQLSTATAVSGAVQAAPVAALEFQPTTTSEPQAQSQSPPLLRPQKRSRCIAQVNGCKDDEEETSND